jgi:hypothetical protein
MPVTTRASSKRFQAQLNKQLLNIYDTKKVGLKKIATIINDLDLDGWTTRPIETYIEKGLNRYTIAPYQGKYTVDSYWDAKNKTYTYNYEMVGVYDLHFLRAIASEFNIEYQSAYGRGTEARNIREAIIKAIA